MDSNSSSDPAFVKHPVFWFDDGSVVLRVEDHAFKIHGQLLSRHSTFFAQSITSARSYDTVIVDPSRRVSAKDFEVFLEHIYHDAPLSSEARYTRIAAILRISSPSQLDFPSIQAQAVAQLRAILSADSSEADKMDKEALSKRKFLYYNLVTSDADFDPEPAAPTTPSPVTETQAEKVESTDTAPSNRIVDSTPQVLLSAADAQLCTALMNHLIEYFTPTLFTPPATSHMACTDVLAEVWMSRVISPALAVGGVYKPLETLERMKDLEWEKDGICAGCVKDKLDEWTEEQKKVWTAMDDWLSAEGKTTTKIAV